MPAPSNAHAHAHAEAERLAAGAFAWLAGDRRRMEVFLATTGAAPENLSASAADSSFLAGVLDFLMADDTALIACCEGLGCRPEDLVRSRAFLPGGDTPHWT